MQEWWYYIFSRGCETNFPRKNGQIAGPGTERSDDIPAMLSDGEFVVNAKAVRGIGRLFNGEIKDKKNARREGARAMYALQRAAKSSRIIIPSESVLTPCKPKRISDNN